MTALRDYLYKDKIKIITTDGDEYTGYVCGFEFADENENGEDIISIEIYRDMIMGFSQNEILSIMEV